MKGPKERLKYDLSRVWECPECHNRTRTSGEVTHTTCGCQSKMLFTEQRCMMLVEDGVRRILP
ncbi:MAG: hypothetical protein QF918_07430 [Pirellulaceae bacterium]|jgi:hypothetical protein|nr:hypothetical protein [Pirellulaceae bacterium]MDP6557327.1 hypothetical protein [Pirellulaceae bacterium]MDP6717191.1 hypothetical protein [Pirellulaceae bacterium]